MLKKIKYKNVTWIDLTNPGLEEIAKLTTEYGLHAVTEEELSHASHRSKVDWYENYIYLILHWPMSKSGAVEIDFILGKDFIITTHYQAIQPLVEFAQILDAGADNKKEQTFHAGHLFYYMIRELYNPLKNDLDDLNHQLKKAEEKIFAGDEATMVHQLSRLNQQLLDIKWVLKFHSDILRSLAIISRDLYGENFDHYLRAIIGEYEYVAELVKNNREIFTELHSTNESLLAIKNGQTMRTLTTLALIFLPVTLIGFIFSISGSENVVQTSQGWLIILLLMLLSSLSVAGLAKYKKWI